MTALTTAWDRRLINRLCADLRAAAELPLPLRRTPIRVWRLSGVERLYLPDQTMIFKYAVAPFTTEDRALRIAAGRGLPVPALRAAVTEGGVLAMLIQDLGTPVRAARRTDAAAVAARIHSTGPAEELPTLDEAGLRTLPARALGLVDQLHTAGQLADPVPLRQHLTVLERHARRRASGATRQPYGLCHGELHPSAIHIGPFERYVLDLAMAHTGPGLLDLASWYGTRTPTDPGHLNDLISAYVAAGGHTDAFLDRGGLPAATWALGWHSMTAAYWHLSHAVRDLAHGSIDQADTVAATRQASQAAQLLTD